MNYAVIGVNSNKTYANGNEAACYRKINNNYPSVKKSSVTNKEYVIEQIFPEPMKIVRLDHEKT